MNKINRRVEYALIGLKHMLAKRPGQLTSAKELNQIYGCPFDVASRVMQILAQRGILRSEQGPHGGYQIHRDLSKVSLYDLIEMILGPVEVAKCMEGTENACEIHDRCNIISPMQSFNRKLIEFYRGLPVLELIEPRSALRASALEQVASEVPL